MGCASNLEERLERHNQKSKGFTGSINDWKIVYIEIFLSKEDTVANDHKIKSWKSRIKSKNLFSKRDNIKQMVQGRLFFWQGAG